jgi:hypothetical protein
MTDNYTKKKLTESSLQKSEQVPGNKPLTPPILEERIAERNVYWSQAITDLEGKEFASVEEAIDSVISLVLERMNVEGESQEEVRELLLSMFETDPELTAELKSSLNI